MPKVAMPYVAGWWKELQGKSASTVFNANEGFG
jgi:hypothetical protein